MPPVVIGWNAPKATNVVDGRIRIAVVCDEKATEHAWTSKWSVRARVEWKMHRLEGRAPVDQVDEVALCPMCSTPSAVRMLCVPPLLYPFQQSLPACTSPLCLLHGPPRRVGLCPSHSTLQTPPRRPCPYSNTNHFPAVQISPWPYCAQAPRLSTARSALAVLATPPHRRAKGRNLYTLVCEIRAVANVLFWARSARPSYGDGI